MRDYAKQRPYSIKIRSDSAPSFPDHSNNSLPSKLPPTTFLDPQPSSFQPAFARPPPFMGEPVHAERASPLFQDFAKYNRKTVATPAYTCLHANLGFATLRFSSSLLCLDEEYVIENRLIPVGLLATFSPNPNNRSN